jgi:hypothetical protein
MASRAQLAAGGWNATDVQVQRSDEGSSVEISAEDGAGRKLKVVRKAEGGREPQLDFQLGDIDEAREPGMTDAQLRDKILRQLRERGLDGDVTVDGDRVAIRARRELKQP